MFGANRAKRGLLSRDHELGAVWIMTDLAPLIYGCDSTTLNADEAALFAKIQPFGFILFARNLENPAQIRALTDDIRAAVGWNAPVMIDQEGGRVARLGSPHWVEFTPALDMADHAGASRLFWLRGCIIGSDLRAAGIDVNCAPVADIARPETHAVLQNRCYGWNVDQVVKNAKAIVAGQAAAGVASIIKHMPGHGLATLDSHHDLPRVDVKRSDLDQQDFAVFKQLNSIEMGMSAHLIYEDIDPHHPATQSEIMIDLIRNDIGFDGLLMSDDISMNALEGNVVDRASKAWSAGCDLVLHCNGDLNEMRALAEAAPLMSNSTKPRVKHALDRRPKPETVDIDALKEEFAALLDGV